MKRAQKITSIVFMVAILNCICVASASVVVSPSSAQVKPGGQLQFTTTGAVDDIVIWSLSGVGCSGINCGEITSNGLYTAPATAPSPAGVVVVATSLFDLTQSGSATVTIGTAATVGVTISPTLVTVAKSGKQQFTANVTGTSNTALIWTVSGVGCVAGSCGTISTSGLYTAPAAVPNPPQATVKATSVADPTKSASATVDIQAAASVSVSVSPSTAQVSAGGQKQFSATVTGSTNTSVNWTVAGTGCSGSSCGSISASGLYTAPASVPTPPTVTITATSVAAPSQSAKATVTLTAATTLTISPSSPQVKPGGQVQFAASGPGSGVVIWSASGSGCSGISCGSITGSGLYTAPAAPPSPATVVVTAASLSNLSISGSTTVTISSNSQVSVTISPASVQVNTGAQQQFTAAVTGNSNTAVTWSVTGFGCAGATCGTVSSSGRYTAPSTRPNPSFVSVTATSVADPTKSSTATVTIAQEIGVSISPASAQLAIGASQQFTAKVTGTTITSVTWSVTGSGCAGSTCGTITTAGDYTAPDTVPTPAQVTVTATSTADGVTSASATVTIIIPIQVTVSPTTAIVTVSDQQQFRATVSGTKNTAVTWSVSGAGCSGAACGTITAAGLYTAPASVPNPAGVTIKAAAQANTSSSASAAVTIAPTNNSKLNGHYAFLFTGFDSNGVYQAAGSFTANGQGKITSGLEDVNNTAAPTTDVSIAGTYQVGADNRGVMTINSPLGTHVFRFALNLLGTKGRFISFDNSGVRGSGVLELQDPTAFDASILAGGYAFNLTGMDSGGSRVGALGLIFPDGSGFVSGSSLDVNDGGIVAPTFGTFDGIYSVDDTTGRGTATLSIPGFGGGTFNFAFYIVSANEFLMISTDPLFLNGLIFSGPAELQSGAPYTTASFNGRSVFSLSGTNGSAPQDTVGGLQFGGSSKVTMIFDQNSGGNITVGGVLNGAYSLQLNGRGTINLADPTTGTTSIWYMYAFAPNEAFLMDASTGAVAMGEMKPQLTVLPFSNADILGTYLFGSGEPIVPTAPLFSGIANFDGGNTVQGQGTITGTEDMSQGSTLTTALGLAGTYSVSSVSNNGRGSILLTSPSGKTIAVWVTSASEFVGLNVDSTTPEPTILYFEQ
jgi:Fe-S cluster assembly iron-binding protein IscA